MPYLSVKFVADPSHEPRVNPSRSRFELSEPSQVVLLLSSDPAVQSTLKELVLVRIEGATQLTDLSGDAPVIVLGRAEFMADELMRVAQSPASLEAWTRDPGLRIDRTAKGVPYLTSREDLDVEEQDILQGRATSPDFELPSGAFLRVAVQGGAYKTGLRLRDAQDHRTLRGWYGTNSPDWVSYLVDLSEYAGRSVYLELWDEGSLTWDHVSVAGVELLQAGDG